MRRTNMHMDMQVDGEPHFTLFVISDLNQMAVEQVSIGASVMPVHLLWKMLLSV